MFAAFLKPNLVLLLTNKLTTHSKYQIKCFNYEILCFGYKMDRKCLFEHMKLFRLQLFVFLCRRLTLHHHGMFHISIHFSICQWLIWIWLSFKRRTFLSCQPLKCYPGLKVPTTFPSFLLSTSSSEEKNYKTLYSLKGEKNVAFFILEEWTRKQKLTAESSKLNMLQRINHCFGLALLLSPVLTSPTCDKCYIFLGRHTFYELELLIMFTSHWISDLLATPEKQQRN